MYLFKVNNKLDEPGKMFLEMDFLESTMKILEDEKKGDEKLIVC